MAESDDYKILKMKVFGPLDRIDRVENIILTGMPDVNYCIGGREGWIELKSPKEPKRRSTRLFGSNHKLSIDQANWMLRQHNANGRCFILIATDKRWMLVKGEHADAVNSMTVDQLCNVASWSATRPVKDVLWDLLKEVLRGAE